MPVEISNGIGTIGDAHSNPNASRVDLLYNPLRVNMSSIDRTDLGAGRPITMHAGDRKKMHLHIGIGSFYFGDQIHPELCPSQFGLLFTYGGNIILLAAGHHTSLTAGAFIQINHHSPTVHINLVSVIRVACPYIKF
jgi:hypothetical protein